ncbi:MAG: DUF2079 domain-containing protein, partial [Ktedonobacteraceae bacterium]
MKRFDLPTQQKIAWGFLILIILIYMVEMSYQAILRYVTFKAGAFDLGNMDQVLWNTIHGRFFQFTNQAIDWYGPPTRLAIHFEPIILPLSLLYAFHADPRILLVFQTLVLGSGALPVFIITRKYIPEWPIFATLMAAAYLLSPALLGLNIFDFHPVSLATPLLLYAILALTYKRYVWFLIACVLACMCKEDIPLSVALLGILVIWKYKLPRLGTVLLIGGLLWSFIAFKVIIPHFYPGVQANNYWYRYEALGSSPGAAIANLIIHPWLLFTTFFTLDRFYYLVGLVRSVGFLPLLAPEWLLPALPSLAVNLLSTDPLLYSGVYHYNAAIIPFVMISAIHGTRRLIIIWQGWRQEQPTNLQQSETYDTLVTPELVAASQNLSTALETVDIEPTVQPRLAMTTSSLSTDTLTTPTHLTGGTYFIAFFNSSLFTRLNHIVDLIKPRVIRLTLPSWRHEQWQRFSARMSPLAKMITVFQLQWVLFTWIVLLIWLNYMIAIPQLSAFWADHTPGIREEQIQRVLELIPPDASVSAGTSLNPHLSERQLLAVFPSVCLDTQCNHTVQYVIVDLNDVTVENPAEAINELNGLSKLYRPLARA